jgi:hypothetical protein
LGEAYLADGPKPGVLKTNSLEEEWFCHPKRNCAKRPNGLAKFLARIATDAAWHIYRNYWYPAAIDGLDCNLDRAVHFSLGADSEERVDDNILFTDELESPTPAAFLGECDSKSCGSTHLELSTSQLDELLLGTSHDDFDFVTTLVGDSRRDESIAAVVPLATEHCHSTGVGHQLAESIKNRHSGSLDKDSCRNAELTRSAMFKHSRPLGVSDPHEV